MRGKNILWVILVAIICLSGCASKEIKMPLEDTGMVGIISFDYIDEEFMKLSVSIPQYSPDAKEPTQVYSVITDLVSDGVVKIEALSDKKVVLNQLRVVLVNEEFARSGKTPKVIRHLYRNPEVGNKVLIAIVKESGEKLLKGEYPEKTDINYYLNDLLQPSINTAFNPNTNVHDFMYTQTNPVFETIVPLLEKKDGKVEISGVALFNEKKMVQSVKAEEALIIQALQGQKKLAPLALTLNQSNGEEKLLLDLIDSKIKMESNKSMQSPKLTISLKIKGTLVEFKGEREDKLKRAADISKLEKDIDHQIEEELDKFLAKLKELEIDPIGLTENFRMYYDGKWKKENTKEIIRNLQWDIQVETSIISTGTLK